MNGLKNENNSEMRQGIVQSAVPRPPLKPAAENTYMPINGLQKEEKKAVSSRNMAAVVILLAMMDML